MAVAIALPSLELSEDEKKLVTELRGRIEKYAQINARKQDFYEGKQKVEHLDIAVPPQLKDLFVSVGWPGTVVDVLEERLDWQGWNAVTGDLLGLDDIYRDNLLALESSRAHLEALITGTGFVTVGKGDTTIGEPEVLITVESASSTTALWDYRTRRVTAALSQTRDENNNVILESLYLPNETILFERVNRKLSVVDRQVHNLGRVLVSRLRNRDRAFDLEGRSEITKPVMYYTDAACRTMLGMEINREFYTAPQRYALGAEPEQFGVTEDSTADERIMAGWRVAMGRLNIIPATEDGDIPTMGQFNPAPPTPYIEQIKAYSQMVSSESGIPATYLGFVTENPPSADSIRQAEYRLVKRAERRQVAFGQAWREVGYLALLARDQTVNPDDFKRIGVKWRDAATPTRAAAADEAMKLVSAQILTPDSGVTYDRVGLSPEDQERVIEDKRKARVKELINGLPAAGAAARQDPNATQMAQQGVSGANGTTG
ncbi:phage portal protein [Nocardia sp. NPDC059246]|uniref:phage portal protein n=1 Tax=unclassified Nocardia TaxID=2637762 RepID=UPI0036935A51